MFFDVFVRAQRAVPLQFLMKYSIKTVPNARRNAVKEENGLLKVYVTAPAVDGKANKAVQKVLADHFKVRASQIFILKGEKSREKLIEILP